MAQARNQLGDEERLPTGLRVDYINRLVVGIASGFAPEDGTHAVAAERCRSEEEGLGHTCQRLQPSVPPCC